MQAIAGGEERAFAELYRRYGRRMYRLFYRMLWRDALRAEDFVQELFLKIIERPQAYDPARHFSTWLYTLALNLCRNEYRRQSRSPIDLPGVFADVEAPVTAHPAEDPTLELRLRAAIDALEEPQRQCFVLRYQEELPVRDIAEIMGCPEGTVKSRLHYALRAVRQSLYRETPVSPAK